MRGYAQEAPAGLVVDSRAIKQSVDRCRRKQPHTQTVIRVINFLDDLGKQLFAWATDSILSRITSITYRR